MGPAGSHWAAGASFFTWISSRGFIYLIFFLVSSPVLSVHESTVWKQKRSLVREPIRKTQRQLQFAKLELTK